MDYQIKLSYSISEIQYFEFIRC